MKEVYSRMISAVEKELKDEVEFLKMHLGKNYVIEIRLYEKEKKVKQEEFDTEYDSQEDCDSIS